MFLNNLEDFSLAMRIYSIAGQAVTQGTVLSVLYLVLSLVRFVEVRTGKTRSSFTSPSLLTGNTW